MAGAAAGVAQAYTLGPLAGPGFATPRWAPLASSPVSALGASAWASLLSPRVALGPLARSAFALASEGTPLAALWSSTRESLSQHTSWVSQVVPHVAHLTAELLTPRPSWAELGLYTLPPFLGPVLAPEASQALAPTPHHAAARVAQPQLAPWSSTPAALDHPLSPGGALASPVGGAALATHEAQSLVSRAQRACHLWLSPRLQGLTSLPSSSLSPLPPSEWLMGVSPSRPGRPFSQSADLVNFANGGVGLAFSPWQSSPALLSWFHT